MHDMELPNYATDSIEALAFISALGISIYIDPLLGLYQPARKRHFRADMCRSYDIDNNAVAERFGLLCDRPG